MKRGFLNYLKGYGFFLLISILLQMIIGFSLGITGLNINEFGMLFIALAINIGTLLYVSEWRDLSFWKLLGFTILVNLVLSLIMGVIIFIVLF